jgi:hypothetical protein
MSTQSQRLILSLAMSLGVFAIAGALRIDCCVSAQETIPSQPANKEKETDARLDEILREWRKAERASRDRHYSIRSTEDRGTGGMKETARGEVLLHKPNILRVDVRNADGNLSDILLCNGKSIRWYQFPQKGLLCGDLPETFGFPEKPVQYPDGFLNKCVGGALEQIAWMFMGTLANEPKERFEFTLHKEDKDWIYLDVEPRERRARSAFESARIVLDASSYRVRQISLREIIGYVRIWDFEEQDIDNKEVTSDSIMKGLPEDFKEVRFPPDKAEKQGAKP